MFCIILVHLLFAVYTVKSPLNLFEFKENVVSPCGLYARHFIYICTEVADANVVCGWPAAHHTSTATPWQTDDNMFSLVRINMAKHIPFRV